MPARGLCCAARAFEKAKLFVIAIVDKEKSLALVDLLRAEFPHVQILARARDRIHVYELIRHGLTPAQIYRDTLGTSLDMSVDALRAMGMRGTQAARVVKIFREREQATLPELAAVYDGDRKVFVSTARAAHPEPRQSLQGRRVVARRGPPEWRGPRLGGPAACRGDR